MSGKAIEGLKPEILWNRFYEITQIPRPSKKEEKILTILRAGQRKINSHLKQDKVGNLVVSIPASSRYGRLSRYRYSGSCRYGLRNE